MQVVASCLMSLQPVLAAEPSIPANTYALISGVIGMAGSLADNADRQNAAMGTGGGDPWLWDLTHNLAPPLPGSRAPRSQHFPSAEQVLRRYRPSLHPLFPPPLSSLTSLAVVHPPSTPYRGSIAPCGCCSRLSASCVVGWPAEALSAIRKPSSLSSPWKPWDGMKRGGGGVRLDMGCEVGKTVLRRSLRHCILSLCLFLTCSMPATLAVHLCLSSCQKQQITATACRTVCNSPGSSLSNNEAR